MGIAASKSIVSSMREARRVITSGFLYFFRARMIVFVRDTAHMSPAEIHIAGVRVDREASNTAPLTRRIAEVLSCDVESQRL